MRAGTILQEVDRNFCGECPLRTSCVLAGSSHTLIRHRYRAEQPVFVEGSRLTGLHVVCAGAVMVTVLGESGVEAGMRLVGAGGILDATDVLLGRSTHSLSATCLGDAAIASIRPDRLRGLMERSPDMTMLLLREVTTQMWMLEERYLWLLCRDAYARTVHALLSLAEITGPSSSNKTTLPFRLKRSALAGIVGTSRETISRVMARLQKHGLVVQAGLQTIIPDLARLRDAVRSASAKAGAFPLSP